MDATTPPPGALASAPDPDHPGAPPADPAPGAAAAAALAPPRATPLVLSLLAIIPLSMLAGAASLLAGALVTQLALVLATFHWARRTGYRPGRLLRLGPPPPGALWLGAAVGVAGILAGAGLQSLTKAALPRWLVERFDVGRLLTRAGWSQVVMMAVISLAPALCEELAFRGGLLSARLARRTPARAIGLSALVFALFHLDPVRFPGVLLLGVVFGWLAWRTGSLWPSMAAHAVNNGTAVVGLWLAAGAADAGPADVLAPGEAAALLAVGLGIYALLAAAANRWLPPPPQAASFLVARVAPLPPVTTSGAAPSP